MGWYGLDLSVSGYGLVEGSCEHSNEPSGSIKYFIAAQLAASQKATVPWSQLVIVGDNTVYVLFRAE
jgi:hypothetical protein